MDNRMLGDESPQIIGQLLSLCCLVHYGGSPLFGESVLFESFHIRSIKIRAAAQSRIRDRSAGQTPSDVMKVGRKRAPKTWLNSLSHQAARDSIQKRAQAKWIAGSTSHLAPQTMCGECVV